VTITPSTVTATTVSPPSGVVDGAIEIGGLERTYRLYVPESLPDGPVPLFIGLHGGTGWGEQFARSNGIEALADRDGFLVVHPDGTEIGTMSGRVWNGGTCCGPAVRNDVDDVAFIDAVVAEIAGAYAVDPSRVYAFGHSNGGIMSYRLACELSDRIAGIGVFAGTLSLEPCEPERPVSVIHLHGTADENLPYAGGRGPQSLSRIEFAPPRDGFSTLSAAADCPSPSSSTEGIVTTELAEPCGDRTAQAFVSLEGCGHAWPGSDRQLASLGPPCPDVDATDEIVEFLLAHPRP
jgi:polyhydroxybutyrate depolymerase